MSYESKLEFAPLLEVSGGFVRIGYKEFYSPRLTPHSAARAFAHPIVEDMETGKERLVAHCYYYYPFHAIAEETTGVPRLVVRLVYFLVVLRICSNRRVSGFIGWLRAQFGGEK